MADMGTRRRRRGHHDTKVVFPGGEVCQMPWGLFPETPVPNMWEALLDSKTRALRMQQTLGTWGDDTYERGEVNGVFAEVKITPSPDLRGKFDNCVAERGLYEEEYDYNKPDFPYPYPTEPQPAVRDWVALHTQKAAINRVFVDEISASAYRKFYLAFENVFPITMLENAIVTRDKEIDGRDRDIVDGKYSNDRPFIHRDGLPIEKVGGQEFVPAGEMFVFVNKDPEKPAAGVTTTWYTSRVLDQLVHSRPLVPPSPYENLRFTRYIVYVPKEDIERAFPGKMVPKITGEPEIYKTEDLRHPIYVGGGHPFDLPPHGILIQAANILPPLIDMDRMREHYEEVREAVRMGTAPPDYAFADPGIGRPPTTDRPPRRPKPIEG
jgi:hypothetical protein